MTEEIQDAGGIPDLPPDEPMLYHWSVALENSLYSAVILFLTVFLPLISMEDTNAPMYALAAYAGLTGFAIYVFYWRWRRTTVTFRENDLHIFRDTLFKQDKKIPYNRIASINVNRGVIDRVLGTSRLMFNINSSVNSVIPEAVVTLRTDLADKIRHDLSRKIYGSNLDAHTEDNVIPSVVSISNRDIILHSFLSQPTVTALTGVFFLGVSIYETYFMMAGGELTAMLILALTFFITFGVIPITVQLIHYYNYKIYRIKDTVYIKCGMIRLYNTSFKVNKINAVRLKSPFLARLMGRSYLEAEVVGLGASDGNEKEITPLMCPLKDRRTIDAVMSQVIPEFVYDRSPVKQPRIAVRTIYARAAVLSLISVAGICSLIYQAVYLEVISSDLSKIFYILSATVVIVFFLHGELSRRIVEMDTGEDHFSFLRGVLDRVLTTVAYDKVQTVRIRDGPLTRPYGLATCRVRLLTASGSAPVVSGYFRAKDLEVISETVLERIKDGRYDYRAYL
ncbi:MAG: PH domain-containing protein [Thermoplasmatales archaeon]|nr:PH domain-containing protein [Thermoplasmatales archaeon]